MEGIGKGRTTRLFYNAQNTRKDEQCYKWPKNKLRKLTQLLSGHIELNRHLYQMGKIESPLCKCKLEDETVDHHLLRCPLFARKRFLILGKFVLSNSELPLYRLTDLFKFHMDTKRMEKPEWGDYNPAQRWMFKNYCQELYGKGLLSSWQE